MEYALIGQPVAHSLSPRIHAAFGNDRYTLCPLQPEELGAFLSARRFSGLNVTLPYKRAVIPYLDQLDLQAAQIGAVNTIINRNGVLCGCNTDYGGLEDLLSHAGIALSGRKVLILGDGGAARTAAAVARAHGAAQILRVSRTQRDGTITCLQASFLHSDAQVLLNATPVGMTPDVEACPIDLAPFDRLEGVVDLIYTPLRTRLCLEASRLENCRVASGLYMLVSQAARAAALFTGQPVQQAQIEAVYQTLRAEQTNFVLIGMPGCGKTTVGKILAQKTGREFVDSDEEIVKRTGMSIPALFAERGEAYFREQEAEVLRALAQRTGCVLATGGGAVLREDNVLRLKQTGLLCFLDRPVEALTPDAGRPLADSREKLAALYRERRPFYASAADATVPPKLAGAEEAAAEIARLL